MKDQAKREIAAIRTLDNVPTAKGMKLWLIENTYSPDDEESAVAPRAVTVLRISDGEGRSLLLRYENGSETRWRPEPSDIRLRGLYATLPNALAAAKARNAEKAKVLARDIERSRKRLQAFKRQCGLK